MLIRYALMLWDLYACFVQNSIPSFRCVLTRMPADYAGCTSLFSSSPTSVLLCLLNLPLCDLGASCLTLCVVIKLQICNWLCLFVFCDSASVLHFSLWFYR